MSDQFVSRAGEKLQHALDTFDISVGGKVCTDFGAAKGGFTDCLLQNGAAKVYAVETGYGVLDIKLRENPRVVVMEKTNAMHVKLPEKVDFVSVDVSWTPQRIIIPQALARLKDGGNVVSLLKPHYEAEPWQLENGKLKEKYLDQVIEEVRSELAGQGIDIKAMTKSPILGGRAENIEYLLWIKPQT